MYTVATQKQQRHCLVRTKWQFCQLAVCLITSKAPEITTVVLCFIAHGKLVRASTGMLVRSAALLATADLNCRLQCSPLHSQVL
jgi:hypothetical protein